MSEDFLKRWSQRKRDVAEAEEAKRPAPEDSADENAAPAGDVRSDEPVNPVKPVKRAEPPKPAFDIKDLPPIESITAATDIRPFLAPGVPADIARAALRRAWSADPRIRDFVGLADYDWDYHATGGPAGFGPLEMTAELRQAVARLVGEIADTATPAPGKPTMGTESREESRVSAAGMEAAPTALSHGPDGSLPDRLSEDAPARAALESPDAEIAVLQHESPQNEVRRTIPRRGHGRALPK
jgi:Protein of unknown function (DUF3306)